MKNLGLIGLALAVAFSSGMAVRHLWSSQSSSSQNRTAAVAATTDAVNAPDQAGLSERQKMARMIARIAARSAAQTTRSMIANRNSDAYVANIEAAQPASQAAAETR